VSKGAHLQKKGVWELGKRVHHRVRGEGVIETHHRRFGSTEGPDGLNVVDVWGVRELSGKSKLCIVGSDGKRGWHLYEECEIEVGWAMGIVSVECAWCYNQGDREREAKRLAMVRRVREVREQLREQGRHHSKAVVERVLESVREDGSLAWVPDMRMFELGAASSFIQFEDWLEGSVEGIF
jgi:hypothetical protein